MVMRVLAFLCVLCPWTALSASECLSIDGAAKLWQEPAIRYLIVGENHGTNEIPALFGDLVCSAADNGRPIVVELELNEANQEAIDLFISSDGGASAKSAFLQIDHWASEAKDGRSSRAYFDLIDRLRSFKKSGKILDVVGIQPDVAWKSQSEFNAAMADRMRGGLAMHPEAMALVLVGRLHARKTPLQVADQTIVPAAAGLPPEQTVSLIFVTDGLAWNCLPPYPANCGPHSLHGDPPVARAVTISPQEDGAYDGTIDVGAFATASPPMAGQ